MWHKRIEGANAVCKVLQQLGVTTAFGLPGTQTLSLFEALRRSSIRTVLTTSELAATFMANGYYRTSGKVGLVTTIPGPGFTLALTGLAEAREDSAALIYLVLRTSMEASRRFRLQALDQVKIATPVVKRVLEIDEVDQISAVLTKAYREATTGEPGPIMVEVAADVLDSVVTDGISAPNSPDATGVTISDESVAEVINRLARSQRPLMFVGQGCATAPNQVMMLAELLECPVSTTCSGRGTLPENHPLSFRFDFSGGAISALNSLVESSDLVLALGCKFTQHGSAGYRLKIRAEKLIHVDASAAVLGANYPASIAVQCDVPQFLDGLIARTDFLKKRDNGWDKKDLQRLQSRACDEMLAAISSLPVITGATERDWQSFFGALRRALPPETLLVTDSGQHQVLIRNYWEALSPRCLLVPSDYQSMGFCLPAAIGAAIGHPGRPVVAAIGDGGFAMSGMELLTAIREELSLVVLLFNNGSLGQIRSQQLARFGHEYCVGLTTIDYRQWAESLGIGYSLLRGSVETLLKPIIGTPGVHLVEVRVGDQHSITPRRLLSRARNDLRHLVDPRIVRWMKSLIRRG